MTTASPQRTLSGTRLLAAYLLLCVVIGAIWYAAHAAYEAALLRERGRQLTAIAELKIAFIQAWLEERRGNAAVLGELTFLAALPGREAAQALAPLLEKFRAVFDYEAILLFDGGSQLRAMAGAAGTVAPVAAAGAARTAMTERRIVFSNASAGDADKPRRLEIAFPLLHPLRPSAPVAGALVFHLDPQKHLDPFLQQWPGANASGESFLFERAGREIVYLTSLRHADATRLRRRADDADLPAALAVRGSRGVVEGRDYRGVPVLAAVGQVPDMPWYVVAKLDREEVLAPLRRQARWSAALTALFLLALGVAMLVWRRGDARVRAEAERLRQCREQRDTLVREVHHRIKNHLQGLAGLLRRQMAAHPDLAPLLGDVIAQIGAIAIVHGLQGRTTAGRTSLRGLVEEIARFLGGLSGAAIEWSQDEKQCFGETACRDQKDCRWALVEAESVSLALVLNELLTNALRHGSGPVTLDLACNAAGARLLMRNPGRLAAGVDLAAGTGLGTGLTLVRALLPPQGVALRLAEAGGGVETRLEITPPVLAPITI